ncbi:Granzyme H [Camelus dromedarius]|uniref:Granzyme H n=1 Tax=Camelus dromedarius TaxID=9838 RepID=A0A5N4E4W5_CAMDR|nr:Granzyme H [Camelus dromedarius]
MQPLLLVMAVLLPAGRGQLQPCSAPVSPTPHGSGAGPPVTPHSPHALCSLCSSINVTLGAHNIKKQEGTQQVVPVRRAIPHPDYNPKDHSSDIMLLQLQRKAKQTAAVRPLRLPGGRARVKPGQACAVAGWGQVAVGVPATTLQEAVLTVQEDRVCESLFPGYYSHATQICVGDPSTVKTSFKGDSGGPLVCKNLVQGIFSCGKQNGTPPGVFTKVSHFLPWIKRTMKRL